MTTEELVRALQEELTGHPQVDFAVLFGSWARSQARSDSDVDVAFMPVGEWTLAEELDLQGTLSRAAGASVDLVRLDAAPLLLAWEGVSGGMWLCGDQSRFARYRAEVALEHAEMAPLLDRTARHYARQIAELGVPR